MTPTTIFLLGAVGALAPEVVRLYNLKQEKADFSLYYFAISLAFAGLGGLVAVILPTTTPLSAFYAGISTPVVVSTALRQAGKRVGELRGGAPASAPRHAWRRFVDAL